MSSPPLTSAELRTLAAVCDALLPPDHWRWQASVAARVAALLARLPNPDDLARLRRFLALLETPAAGLLLAGRPRRFAALDRAGREAVLRALARHPLPPLRGAFQALKRLAAVAYYADCDEAGANPVWPALGYPGPVAPSPDVPKPIRPLSIERDSVLDCDVVIVGAGAGGGVVAGELAAAGRDVVVLEQGGYRAEPDYTQREVASLRDLYLGGGLRATGDLGIVVLAGSCLGGGTVVNYTTSFRTPDAVREEWARLSGLDFFAGADFTRSLDAVCARLNVNAEHNRPSGRDEIMERGLAALSWHVAAMPRNVAGCTQDDVCGYCGFGCVRGAKRSTLKTYLQDAAERGARIVVDCVVERVVVERGRALGVAARTRAGHALTVRARTVVVAAGAIGSPALLLRSGLDGAVGRNLFLHPVTAVWGLFPEEVRPWAGTLQARYSDRFADLDAGYGVRFETTGLHPGLLALGIPWDGAPRFDHRMRLLPHTSFVGLLLRDRVPGRLRVTRAGVPVLDYRIAAYDRRHLRRAVEGAARVLLAAGAREVLSTQNRTVSYRPGGHDTVEDWLARVDRVGYGANQTLYSSFHQMGTCRMGADPATSVVDGAGEAHAVRGLYVADASLFPSASGVNPMISVAALAHYVAQGLT